MTLQLLEHSSVLYELLWTHELHLACSLCSRRTKDIIYHAYILNHQCIADILLVRQKNGTEIWRPISQRPTFPNPQTYVVCRYFEDGKGCTRHGNRCSFARSSEEAAVWNFQKRHGLDHHNLRSLIAQIQFPNYSALAKPLSTVERILQNFPGLFIELCENCFYSSPQELRVKGNTAVCKKGHPWKSLLVHYQQGGQGMVVVNDIRPQPISGFQFYRPCRYAECGQPCKHGPKRCMFAHNQVEMEVWTAEIQEGLNRSELLWLSRNRHAAVSTPAPSRPRLYCKVCRLDYASEESFMNHCASQDHERMICEDVTTEWKHRPPPENINLVFQLCDSVTSFNSPSICVYGDNCILAHSIAELNEWRMRDKAARRKVRAAEEEGLLSYQERLLKEYRNSLNEVLIMSENVPGVTVSCDKDMTVSGHQELLPLKWTFRIKPERPLMEVALLKQDPGAKFILGEIDRDDACTYATGERFRASDMSYEIPVSFKASNPGLYEQWLVFDFDMRPVLLRKLEVRVGEHTSIRPIWINEDDKTPVQTLERWHQGNRVIIPCLDKKEAEEHLMKEYKPPEINLQFNPRSKDNTVITIQNYKKKMHDFLYREELAEDEVVSRLSLKVTISLSHKLPERYFEKKAPRGTLVASVPVSYMLTPDTPEGFILKREIRSALVTRSLAENNFSKVYEANILEDVISEDKMLLLLSKRCCTELGLQNGMTCEMEVQFQLNRLPFCHMHKAIDLLPDVEMVLPDLKKSCVPEHGPRLNEKLNEKQQAAISFILGDPSRTKTVAPLLIYGPFGTGKTFTMATAVKELVRQPGTKVLICAHTNSSADLYVKEYFHKYVSSGHDEARPLRIKTNKMYVRNTDPITLQYCNLSPDCQSFMLPDLTTLDMSKIIITTTVTAKLFQTLKLPVGYFTHILIDEASQMLECEALIPLGLAGKGTRVILAGDHMQMGPKLFSVEEDQRSNHTLLNRLYHHYQAEEDQSVASQSRIIFNENYRSTKEIVDFVSKHFYVGKSPHNAIMASGNVPPHPQCHPLRFHHVQGKCHLDTSTMSWYNLEEVACVAEIVQKLFKEWPSQWGNREQKMLCVLSEGMQVLQIREKLRELKLGGIVVENSQNVQGKQFRAIVVSTIHTRDSLRKYDTACLDFFNDPRVMNTVMTRAQSQVIVVGDAAALCYFGKCSRIWKSYIKQCIGKDSAEPKHLKMEYVEQEVREIARFTKKEDDDSSDTESSTSEIPEIDDPILKELLDESNNVRVTVTSEGLLDIVHQDHSSDESESYGRVKRLHQDFSGPELQQLLITNPNDFKLCELTMKRFDSGYARSLHQPTLCIDINGRRNVGHSFPGDHVVVEILNRERSPPSGKVLGVVQKSDLSLFVCTSDSYDPQVMTPINNCVSKIYTPFWKDKPNHIAVRKIGDEEMKPERFVKIDEETKRNNLFVVRVLKWRERFRYPLGIVVKVLPKVTTFEGGMEVLDIEYPLARTPPPPVQEEVKRYKDTSIDSQRREDYRDHITFTIDPVGSKDLDDAISVRDLGRHYEVGVHIADIASFVTKDSPTDKYAQKQGTTFYPPEKEPAHMFPKDLSADFFSLLPGYDRHTISLMVLVDKETHRILGRQFALSVIRSDRQMSYEDAEQIIQKTSKGNKNCDTVEGCLAMAFNFSKKHRKDRLQEDWWYKRPDEEVHLGEGKSHKMVEELMIMFNNAVAEKLLTTDTTRSLTPIRCQERPDPEKICQLRDKYSSLIPLSIHLSCCLDNSGHPGRDRGTMESKNDQGLIPGGKAEREPRVCAVPSVSNTFTLFTSLIKSLESAAERKDIYKMMDLIITDDIHPQLLPVVTEFRKLLSKAYVIRSNSTTLSKIGHYDLQLDCYTWASSPIRRFSDIIVQRMLHSVLGNTDVKYTTKEIDMLCADFSEKYAKQSEYEKKAQCLRLASQLSQQSAGKLAFVIDVSLTGHSFHVSFPLNNKSLPNLLPIMYRDLQLTDQPEYDEESHCVTLKWTQRVYSFTNRHIHSELKQHHSNSLITLVQLDTWKDILSALRTEKWDSVLRSIEGIRSRMDKNSNTQSDMSNGEWQPVSRKTKNLTRSEPGHYVELSLNLKVGETLQVQLGTDTKRGLLVPAVQLLNVCPKFEICLEHVKNPTMCFSKYAVRASKQEYKDYMEYQKIWKPLCEMESASNAVAENDSIVLEDVKVTWKKGSKDRHPNGFFRLPLEKKKEWAIECDLLNCLLCIRLRDQKDHSCTNTLGSQPSSDLVDPKTFTWVAHGRTTAVTDEEESKRLLYVQIDFCINQVSMENPPSIIGNTNFTVELIPKLLPDVRKEAAVSNLAQANQLVKNIALGRKPSPSDILTGHGQKRWNFDITKQAMGFPPLNDSQTKAIKEALDSPFTLIQGPPGTGKTVVGVHIVYWFLTRNKEMVIPTKKKDDNVEKKKDGCILYCGPSNKSVDVVAEHLLKLKEELKPLRVYSEQMEMLEFPYPGSNLKLSRKSMREEKPNQELRSITLHHLIRVHGNQFANDIRAFDARIQNGEDLSDQEIDSYKQLLNRARQQELMKHDIILCTCTAASNPNFTKMLNFQQIVIDECAMATEPEAFIPLVSHKPAQIVLLGDHKQLQPIVHCDLVKRLGMKKSLFERYMRKALMLDTQYRMHESICEFPSQEFYYGRLKTGRRNHRPSVLQTKSLQLTPILFGHVLGEEISLVVSTERGNENSKANLAEAEQAVRVARLLISQAQVDPGSIAILTPYNAQVAKINETLCNKGIRGVTVSTIMKSQGSEWRYVILSTVRSRLEADIDNEPTKAWLTKNLGFIMDPNQINVGITRAQEGLCIIGNRYLLNCCSLWKSLLKHYEEKNCVMNSAKDIRVQNPTARKSRNSRRSNV